jgi:hypothetical protein
MAGSPISRQFKEFTKALESIKGLLPPEVKEGVETVLLGVFEMIRMNRNDAGHPTGRNMDKEVIYAHLQVFVTYCKKIYQLIDAIKTLPIPH